jgi:hypothetical protein
MAKGMKDVAKCCCWWVFGGKLMALLMLTTEESRPVWAIAQQIDFPLAVFRFLRGICTPGAVHVYFGLGRPAEFLRLFKKNY